MAKDYYEILGISKNATGEEIKQAFRKLAHQHHPDKEGGDEKKFKEINEAYQILGNPEKRKQYDQFGQTFEQAQSQGGFSGFNGFRDFSGFTDAFRQGNGQSFEFNFSDLGDMFGDFFGGRAGKSTKSYNQRRGSDIEIKIEISFREAVFGAEKEVQFSKNKKCEQCKGSGAQPGSKVIKCQYCGGSGQVVKTIGFGIGFSSICSECQGQGERYEKNCSHCHGTGIVKDKRVLSVKVPAGIEDGQSIRLSGEGEAGARGGRTGDLYIHVRVKTDQKFQRDDYNIISKHEISFSLAALGGATNIETIDGTVELKIPEGTQSQTIFRLRQKGVPYLQGKGRGDHLVEIIIKTPTRLNRRQRELLKELDQG